MDEPATATTRQSKKKDFATIHFAPGLQLHISVQPRYGSWLITQIEACNNAVKQVEDTCLLYTPAVPYSHFIESAALGIHQIHFQ